MKKFVITLLALTNLAFAEGGTHKHGVQNKTFDKVLQKYEGLHKAFFDNDASKIKANAKAVLKEIETIKDKKLSKTLKYTQKKLTEISNSDDIKANKKAMNTVSQGLLVVLEKHAPNKNYARYYCPMVQKYWIQNISVSEKVMNPYASDSMPHCGAKK